MKIHARISLLETHSVTELYNFGEVEPPAHSGHLSKIIKSTLLTFVHCSSNNFKYIYIYIHSSVKNIEPWAFFTVLYENWKCRDLLKYANINGNNSVQFQWAAKSNFMNTFILKHSLNSLRILSYNVSYFCKTVWLLRNKIQRNGSTVFSQ